MKVQWKYNAVNQSKNVIREAKELQLINYPTRERRVSEYKNDVCECLSVALLMPEDREKIRRPMKMQNVKLSKQERLKDGEL